MNIDSYMNIGLAVRCLNYAIALSKISGLFTTYIHAYSSSLSVPSSGKMNSSQVQPSSKTIPIRVLETPTEPPRITLEPNQWNKTLTTDGIKHPFKVEKIESLHGDTTPKGIV